MNSLSSFHRITQASNREEYLKILTDTCVMKGIPMTTEEYEYYIDDMVVFEHPQFCIWRRYGSEFYVAPSKDEDGEYAFNIHEIATTKVHLLPEGGFEVSYDKDCPWPSVLDYIEEAGFPIPFKVFKEYD